jgi:hypothetical protein
MSVFVHLIRCASVFMDVYKDRFFERVELLLSSVLVQLSFLELLGFITSAPFTASLDFRPYNDLFVAASECKLLLFD